MPLKRRARRGFFAALLPGAWTAAVAAAQCPPMHDIVDDRASDHAGTPYTVTLCSNPQGDASGSLQVLVYQGERLAGQAGVPVDVEGEVRAIRFDGASYALSAKAPTFPVLVEARLRGATFDQYSTDLWLFTLDAGRLKRVLAQNVAWQAWGMQCEPDCIDTTRGKTVVIVVPQKSPDGMSDLRLRTRGTSTPHGKGNKASKAIDQTSHYMFDGQAYRLRD
jgi:hypothetical protein